MRRMAFYLALGFIFVRISFLHEILTGAYGLKLYLPWLLGAPAIVGMILSGGIRRAFRASPVFFWTAFAVCLVVATPFSSWKGGSVDLLSNYFKVNFPMLFMTAGLPVDWRECKQMMYSIALAAVASLVFWYGFAGVQGGRLQLAFGSIGNPNDLAAHLLVVLPFLLFVTEAVPNLIARAPVLLVVCWGVYSLVGTGSRGGLLALMAAVAFLFLRAPNRVRIGLAVLAPLVAVVVLVKAPQYALERQATMFSDETPSGTDEASASRSQRIYLLKKSILYTLQHPLVGVGPGEFMNFEGGSAIETGERGAWRATHNSYTQVSSEAGIPALFFFLAAILSSYRLLSRTYREARAGKEHREIAMAALYLMLSMVGFCCVILFLSMAYGYQLLVLSGCAVSLSSTWRLQQARANPSSSPPAASAQRSRTPASMRSADAVVRSGKLT